LHKQLWEQLIAADLNQVAKCGVCKYLPDENRFFISMLGHAYSISVSEKRIYKLCDNAHESDASFLEQLCILAYLLNSKEIPLSGKLVTAEKLQSGQFFFRGPHLLPTRKLEESFGESPDLLYAATRLLNSKKQAYGDASVEILVLPRLPLVFVIWGSDQEFSARASILFDETATSQLPLDALMVAVNLTVKAMMDAIS
jgi:hypothetical protein